MKLYWAARYVPSAPPFRNSLKHAFEPCVKGTAVSHGVKIDVRYERRYPPTVNTVEASELCARVAQALVGRRERQP